MYHDLKMNTNLANVRLHHLSSWGRCNVNEMEASQVIIADVKFLVMIAILGRGTRKNISRKLGYKKDG